MLPQHSEHEGSKVLAEPMYELEPVPLLRGRTVDPKHLLCTGKGQVSLEGRSQARCRRHSSSLCVYPRAWKDISLPSFTQREFLHLQGETEVVQAFATHTEDEAFPWQQKCHKSYLKNSLGLCNK